ncbi:hypothetical protein IC235_17400 [Hymenobacter sp. BT664]|uniref:Uncharacterized protein n=1 Tax=Hymenobacter montanus TaxID=2771359 RepID=A0A927BGC6_9BACT|nr:hypothetical protein [Hymenobacter montanus]MBD2769669.1 hypothetical protein [Hymenobacter montanus]
MDSNKTLTCLLAPGDIGTIARELGLSHGAAAAAIRRGNPGHPAVRAALSRAEASGALAAAQKLATITSAPAA